jgi:hypothetical protein
MTIIAAIRPDDWNLPLLLHVLGAMLLLGSLSFAAYLLLAPREGDVVALRRFGYWTLLAGGLPSFLLMRIAAEWIYSEEGFGEDDPGWIGIGYITSDLGALLFLIALIVGGIGIRRLRTSDGSRRGLTSVAGWLAVVLVAMYLVAVWAMTAKPG